MRKQGIESGFTLLEVMVAVSIFGLTVITLLGVFSNGLNLLRLTNNQTQAIILAQSKLAEFNAGVERNTAGEKGSLAWKIQTTAIGQGMEQIGVSISRDKKEKIQLVTLKQAGQ
ncbi:prepilin-type N-terminal cleavage/methylation domain-containing protein [Candidatus Desantisbacteria bacterium]|nr:prepilin-type N-terminal cleavage/methylation domain-containing protein [Candidatus Desantisbacteria bacterium]